MLGWRQTMSTWTAGRHDQSFRICQPGWLLGAQALVVQRAEVHVQHLTSLQKHLGAVMGGAEFDPS